MILSAKSTEKSLLLCSLRGTDLEYPSLIPRIVRGLDARPQEAVHHCRMICCVLIHERCATCDDLIELLVAQLLAPAARRTSLPNLPCRLAPCDEYVCDGSRRALADHYI